MNGLAPYLTGEAWVVLIDGRSGAGKSRLASEIARATGASVLALDDLYDGWQGLQRGSQRVAEALDRGGTYPFDWYSMQYSQEWRSLRDVPLVIEGCGALSEENLQAAARFVARVKGVRGSVTSVWIECPTEVRRARALARDGSKFASHWHDWAAQESAHAALNDPQRLAQVVLTCDAPAS